ncbi:pyruvate dehydrogenase (acetyl-transferring) E1 component subunit alpha [Alicyclobacillus curvatus]|nr:pyruvate dehydrogenase (acetyl-transferring) E1 component subunit alpha [Alicyclobacillus curvatus]
MWIQPEKQPLVETFQLLDVDGTTHGEMPELTDGEMLDMFQWMVFARTFDERAVRLQRQGRIGTYAPFSGQEAAQVGSAYAIEKTDWVFPTYRELPVLWIHGTPVKQSLLYPMGAVSGGAVTKGVNAFPVQIIIAAQTLHAMGSAWASQYLGDKSVNVCYLGDGATAQGDFHEALNFASVMKLPVIFFIQNNQWAISVPRGRQAASRTLAQKAVAYDIPGIQVDGNDILGVYKVMTEAVEHARSGLGPVLIEALTYRHGPHTTSDDPTRYRDADEVAMWMQRDPITRFARFLTARGLLDSAKEAAMREDAEQRIGQAVIEAEAEAKGTLPEVFDMVYGTVPRELERQRDEAATLLAGKAQMAAGTAPVGSGASAGPGVNTRTSAQTASTAKGE